MQLQQRTAPRRPSRPERTTVTPLPPFPRRGPLRSTAHVRASRRLSGVFNETLHTNEIYSARRRRRITHVVLMHCLALFLTVKALTRRPKKKTVRFIRGADFDILVRCFDASDPTYGRR